MSNTTTSRVSTLENASVSDLAKHIQSLTDRVDELEQEVAKKDKQITDHHTTIEDKDARIDNC